MARLVEGLSRFFGRVEVLARGAESSRVAAEAALGRGRPLEAREHARALLEKVPGSPLGLALWADAAEEAWLDHEAAEALDALAVEAPWRADVWLRLGRAKARLGMVGAREALERAASAPDDPESSRAALIDLADMDLAEGDAARAERWLDRVGASLTGAVDKEVAQRHAECALLRGDVASAARRAESLGEGSPVDGRRAVLDARLAQAAGDPVSAMSYATRAFSLEAPGATEVLAGLVASCRDVVLVDRARRVVTLAGKMTDPVWKLAFAFAEGRVDDAKQGLADALDAGDSTAAPTLLRLTTEARDESALAALIERHPVCVPEEFRALGSALAAGRDGRATEALDALDAVCGEAAPWAEEARQAIIQSWLGRARAAWPEVLAELGRLAKRLERVDQLSAVEALAVERERPLRLAVVGEFNAGKSTFLNALLGQDVAPTGVLPTTATLHWVAWAPDAFARVLVVDAPDRVVPHADLKATLRSLASLGAKVRRVYIYSPSERLKRVEVLDTPGFNAPDPEHIEAARQAFDEAHVAVWLLDATGPLKETERAILTEIRDLGVPVQILLNKADRLSAGDLGRVLDHVQTSLAEVGLRSYAPPIALSARLALAGKLGDEAAYGASRWSEVETWLAEQIVDRSDALRERALRRKAARIAGTLAAEATARGAGEAEHAVQARADAERARQAATTLRRERAAIVTRVDHATEPARARLAADLRPLREVDTERRRVDEGLRAYVSARFVERLGDAVTDALATEAQTSDPHAAGLIRAVLAGAVAACDSPASITEIPLEHVYAAAVEAFAVALDERANAAVPPASFVAIERRVEALRRNLEPPPEAGAAGSDA